MAQPVNTITPNDSALCNSNNLAQGQDPCASLQWYIDNSGQINSSPRYDLNINNYRNTYNGAGVRIAVSDTGIQTDHEDLSANIGSEFAYDYVHRSANVATPTDTDRHGTAVAGILAAARHNGIGGAGVAPSSKLYNLVVSNGNTGSSNTDIANSIKAAIGLNYEPDIYTASWGTTDDDNNPGSYSESISNAIRYGVQHGRGGLGRIYLWAGGNGDDYDENSNLDAYPAHPDVFAICSVDDEGVVSNFSEPGENLLVCGFGSASNGNNEIFTTNLYSGNTSSRYRANFSGTSAATPTVAGVVALILQANPRLSWREVREILVRTARKPNDDSGWRTFTAHGQSYHFHTQYGFGIVDGGAAIALAQTWSESGWSGDGIRIIGATSTPSQNITQGQTVTINLSVSNSEINFIESAQITLRLTQPKSAGDYFSSNSSRRRPYQVNLISPSGRTSPLLTDSYCLYGCDDINNWRFSSHAFWGESAHGTWKLQIIDQRTDNTDQEIGTIGNLKLEFHGH